ncbi:MAG: hypothetical protein RL701_3115 [Pseudomonadota bacterium]
MGQRQTLPELGEVIAGKYCVERTLGLGGMGAVFEVSHRVTQKRFAVKWLLPELSDNEDATRRLVREAQVAGQFEHPNVVEVYDVGGHQGEGYFIVMELLTGESLAQRLQREGSLSASHALAILRPCMQGIAAAHEAGIIHRDIKPANIFLCGDEGRASGRSKVLDFGIAKLLPKAAAHIDAMQTKTGAIVGTPHYMAPEQMRGHAIDERVDVYALGITFYEVLAGQRPFEATTYAELVLKVSEGYSQPLERFVPDLPPHLAATIARAMARDVQDRWPSVDAMLEALSDSRHTTKPNSRPARDTVPTPPPTARAVAPKTPLSSESMPDTVPATTHPVRRLGFGAGVVAVLGVAAVLALMGVRQRSVAKHAAPPSAAAEVHAGTTSAAGSAHVEETSAAEPTPTTEAPVPTGIIGDEPVVATPAAPLPTAPTTRAPEPNVPAVNVAKPARMLDTKGARPATAALGAKSDAPTVPINTPATNNLQPQRPKVLLGSDDFSDGQPVPPRPTSTLGTSEF